MTAFLTPSESLGARIARLQTEARGLAREHVDTLVAAMNTLAQLGAEIGEGGPAYPAGIRDLARRISEETGSRVQTLAAIQGRGT